ncbi:MAG: hypothetical protein HQL56_14785 [Magnetococcales bacterium]|nr:hypothetical protein [Magnetococcales bacterium]
MSKLNSKKARKNGREIHADSQDEACKMVADSAMSSVTAKGIKNLAKKGIHPGTEESKTKPGQKIAHLAEKKMATQSHHSSSGKAKRASSKRVCDLNQNQSISPVATPL